MTDKKTNPKYSVLGGISAIFKIVEYIISAICMVYMLVSLSGCWKSKKPYKGF